MRVLRYFLSSPLSGKSTTQSPENKRHNFTLIFLFFSLVPCVPRAYKQVVSSSSSGGLHESTGLRSARKLITPLSRCVSRTNRLLFGRLVKRRSKRKRGPSSRALSVSCDGFLCESFSYGCFFREGTTSIVSSNGKEFSGISPRGHYGSACVSAKELRRRLMPGVMMLAASAVFLRMMMILVVSRCVLRGWIARGALFAG